MRPCVNPAVRICRFPRGSLRLEVPLCCRVAGKRSRIWPEIFQSWTTVYFSNSKTTEQIHPTASHLEVCVRWLAFWGAIRAFLDTKVCVELAMASRGKGVSLQKKRRVFWFVKKAWSKRQLSFQNVDIPVICARVSPVFCRVTPTKVKVSLRPFHPVVDSCMCYLWWGVLRSYCIIYFSCGSSHFVSGHPFSKDMQKVIRNARIMTLE